MHCDVTEVMTSSVAHLGLDGAIEGLSAAALIVNARLGFIIQIKGTVARALREKALHRLVANLVLQCGDSVLGFTTLRRWILGYLILAWFLDLIFFLFHIL